MTTSTEHGRRPKELREAWIAFVDTTATFRPALHRYCRRMTDSVWDAEDLVQDTLVRCFDRSRESGPEVRNPRAFLFRTATNLWIDRVRKHQTEMTHADELALRAGPSESLPSAARDAGRTLFTELPPQERAAVVLKDVVEFSLAEIAEILETTIGAVKAALHRGRRSLRREETTVSTPREPPSAELVDRFVAAFNALDIPTLTDLLLEDVTTEVLGIGSIQGRDAAVNREGWLQKSLFGHEPWALEAQTPARQQRTERHIFLGEPIIVVWIEEEEEERVEWICRLEEKDGRVARIRDYCLCPETQREVAHALGLPFHDWGYRLSNQILDWDGVK